MPIVLVVDDSPVDQRLISGLLSSDDLEIVSATTADAAIETLRNQHVDLVITDLVMPDTDGFELTTAVSREFPSIPVVLITGSGKRASGRAGPQSGCNQLRT